MKTINELKKEIEEHRRKAPTSRDYYALHILLSELKAKEECLKMIMKIIDEELLDEHNTHSRGAVRYWTFEKELDLLKDKIKQKLEGEK